jgi:hypothetical protein
MKVGLETMKFTRFLLMSAPVFLGVLVAEDGKAEGAQQAEVIVLSTLHQLHGEVEGYSYAKLSNLIEWLDPDVLALELTASDLASRRKLCLMSSLVSSAQPSVV